MARPALMRWWFAPLFRIMPRWLAANLVTLMSTGTLVLVLVMSLTPTRWSAGSLALAYLLAMNVYVAGDHLDGMQAKATGTSSPLGDWLDHYCDVWAGGILIFGFWTLCGMTTLWALYGMQALLLFGFGVTFAEREQQRALHFTRYGTLEAICVVTGVCATWLLPAGRGWWQAPLVAGLPRYSLVVLLGALMCVGACVVIMRRMGRVPSPVMLFAGGLTALCMLLARDPSLSPIAGWWILGCYGATYVGRVMYGYLVPGHHSWPDRVASTGIGALLLWDGAGGSAASGVPAAAWWALGGYCTLSATHAVWRAMRGLRRYWVWVNR